MKVSDLAAAINQELAEYSEKIDNTIQKEIDKLSKELVNDLKNDPTIPERTGAYKKSFTVKKLAQGVGYKRVVVYSKDPHYRLTHLLEYGHATRSGGRTRAYPHWGYAQEKADTLPKRIKEAIKK